MTALPMTDERVFALLPGVSRTFAISIAVLRGTLAADVATAYLLCRLLDTVEDDTTLPEVERRTLLLDLAGGIEHPEETGAVCDRLVRLEGRITATPCERELLLESRELFLRIQTLGGQRAAVIRRWAAEMARGMAEFVSDLPGQRIQTMADLARYCHFVAGTVGGMLTGLFVLCGPGISERRKRLLEEHMESFGRGLQMVNIIKDCGKDWQLGRSFLPREMAGDAGDFPGCNRSMMASLVAGAAEDLDDAVRYIRALPRRMWRARLFCIYPLVFARKTLQLLGRDTCLPGQPGAKISRRQVKRIMLFSAPAALSNLWLRLACRRRD